MRIRILIVFTLCCYGGQMTWADSLSHHLDPKLLDDLDDDTVALQTAINSLPDGAALHIPAGTLVLSQPLVVDKKRFAIKGVDASLTFLRFSGDQGGLIFQSSQENGDQVSVSDLSLLTDRAGAGPAVYGRKRGKALPPLIDLKRVEISAQTDGFWDYSVKSEYGALTVYDCVFRGKNDGSHGTLAHIDYSGSAGGGKRVIVIRSVLSGARVGVSVHDTDSEEQDFLHSVIEDVVIGAERLTSEPTFKWLGCRIVAEQVGLYLKGVRDTAIAGCLIQVTAPEGVAVVMEGRTTQHVAYHGNLLLGPHTLRVNRVDITGKPSSDVDHVTFSGNYVFGADLAFDLTGPHTQGFSFGGNILHAVNREFSLAPDSTDIRKTAQEDLK